ncbi:regulator [Streptomyces sp. CB00072]|nr:regulator [Streptomyces sp. CB00072]
MASQAEGVQWVKARSSNKDGNCVEVAKLDSGVAIRNSRFPSSGALLYTPDEMRHFIGAAKLGEFDHLID